MAVKQEETESDRASDRARAAGLVPEGDLPELPPLPSSVGENPPVRVTDEQQAHYAEQGYVLFPALIDKQTVAQLSKAVDAMVEHRIGDFSYEPSDPSLIQRITNTHRVSADFQQLLRNEALCGVIAQLIGPSFRHNNVKLNFKPAGVGSAVEWHQDWGEPSAANSVHSGARTHSAVPAGFYPHTNGSVLAAGIFLDDIDSENGPCATRLAPLIRFARRILARARAS